MGAGGHGKGASPLAALDFPDFERDYTFVALRHDSEYPMGRGRLVSSGGVDLPIASYDDYLTAEVSAYPRFPEQFIRDVGAQLDAILHS